MLTMRPRFATVLECFWPVVPRHSPHAVFLMNRDESEWIGMSVIPRFIPNAHECFKRFKTAVACRRGSRITKILLELLQYCYDSRRCLYGAAMNHTDASQFDKSG